MNSLSDFEVPGFGKILWISEMLFKFPVAFPPGFEVLEFLVVEGFGLDSSQRNIICPLTIGSFLSYYDFYHYLDFYLVFGRK